jgi:PAS domain S-box-containing protein
MTESKVSDYKVAVAPDLFWLYRKFGRRLGAGSAMGLAAVSIAVAIFCLDTIANQPIAFAVLYIVVIFVAANTGRRRWVIRAAVGCLFLTAIGFFVAHDVRATVQELVRLLLGVAAVGFTTMYALKQIAASRTLQAQARLLDQAHDSVTVRDLNGVLTYWNNGAVELYGWTPEEAFGRQSHQLLCSKATQSLREMNDILMATGAWEGEQLNRARDGREVIVHSRWSLLRNESDRSTRVLETSYDITERRYADRDLRRSEARYHNLFQTTAMAIWECDFSLVRRRIDELLENETIDFPSYLAKYPHFVREAIDLTIVRDANSACLELFGARTKDELLAAFGQLWPAAGEDAYAKSIIAALEGRQSFECEAVMQTINGKRLAVLFTIAFPPEAASRHNFFVVVADMTATTEAQEALHDAQADLAHAMRLTSLGELTASIAHEVNQPLAGIVSNGQAGLRWLLRDAPDLAATRLSLERVVEEGKRAASVIRGIRALARNDPPQRSPLDINEVIEECLGLLSQEIRGAGIDLSMSLSRNLTDVLADRIQIQQVVINLMLNGIQAMKEVEDRPRLLTVKTWAGASGVTVAIEDSGTGIDPGIRQRLFSAFVTNKADGMGMGLSVCRSIVERSGGRIWADGNDGPGAVFHFNLPLPESLPHAQ